MSFPLGIRSARLRRRRWRRLRLLLLLLLSTRHRLRRETWQLLLARGKVIHGRRDGYGRLLHVVLDNPLVGVEVRVPGVPLIFNWILQDVDARQSRFVERRGIGAAALPAARCRGAEYAQIAQRCQRLA